MHVRTPQPNTDGKENKEPDDELMEYAQPRHPETKKKKNTKKP